MREPASAQNPVGASIATKFVRANRSRHLGEKRLTTFSPLILTQSIRPNGAANESDIVVVKRSLNRLGHYPKSDLRLSTSPDRPLFHGIRAFQDQRGLRVDGVMNPDGETATELGKIFSSPSANPRTSHTAMGTNSVPSEAECDNLYW